MVLVALFVVLPLASGQPALMEPVGDGCADPQHVDCDALVANGGVVRRGEEPTRLLLYLHMKNAVFMKGYVNAQPPDPEFEEDVRAGSAVPTLVTKTGTDADLRFQNNRITGTASPGLIPDPSSTV